MKQLLFFAIIITAGFTSKAQTIADKLVGKWVTEDKTVVEFYKCNSSLCIKQLTAGKEKDRKYNGKVIGKNIATVSDTELKGIVIDPDNNKEYNAKWMVSADGKTISLKVKWGLLSFNEKWMKQ